MSWKKLNSFGKSRTPCIFIINYDLSQCEVYELDRVPQNIRYKLDDFSSNNQLDLIVENPDFNDYKVKFNKLKSYLDSGEIKVANLTTKFKLKDTLDLIDIFNSSNAKYKLYYKDKFVCFSPETYIKIIDNKIHAYPMKGTGYDSQKILNSSKEQEEHKIVVDLMIEELSAVAKDVRVARYRFVDKVGKIYQTSSEIVGDLELDWREKLGDLFRSMLPATSILGSPKVSAREIIDKIENYDRGFYSGVFGIFDGVSVNSCVLIRFIEKIDGEIYFKTGSGVTKDSILENEFSELLSKVYIP